MSGEKSDALELAEAVATKTAERVRAGLKEELDERDARLRELWRRDLGRLRDDLTTHRLLEDLKGEGAADQGGPPVRVLVVDDSPELCRVFARVFESAGMVVSHAYSGADAAAILDADPALEVIVADISMPKNGYTLLEHARKHYPIIEVIMTSGYDTEADRARNMGAFAFLPKPFNMSQAVLIVERAAEFRRLKLAATSRG